MRTRLFAAFLALTVLSLAGAAWSYSTSKAKSDCCYPGSPCCYPGSPCCDGSCTGCCDDCCPGCCDEPKTDSCDGSCCGD
jgi:hypothetical protein